MALPILYIVVPCYNEESVLPITMPLFRNRVESLIQGGRIHPGSRVLFVDDGSKDATWDLISAQCKAETFFEGARLSGNRGHQNALLAGLMSAKNHADITISIDADGQDDMGAMEQMIDEYQAGCDIVYGVRSDRTRDSWFKRTSAEGFYRLMNRLGARVVFNHADYRLLSRRALEALSQFKEVNLFLRGLVPLVGYRSSSVYYERQERMAGKSHYPLGKMLALAFDGITSLSIKPIRLITWLGSIIAIVSFIAIIVVIVQHFVGNTLWGWSSTVCAIFFMGGIQLLCVGVIGEYVGKIYNETKRRPRFIIQESTLDNTPDKKSEEDANEG